MARNQPPWPPEDRELAKFHGPHLAVDVALMTVAPDPDTDQLTLATMLVRRAEGAAAGEWALPGRFVRERERLADAVRIALHEKCGIEGIAPRQLFVADEPGRDDRGWVMSAAHTDTQRWDVLGPHLAKQPETLALAWISRTPRYEVKIDLPGRQRALPFEQMDIIKRATLEMRARYESLPDPDGLLPDEFTVLQLREVHEAVLGHPLDKDLFRRKHVDRLIPTDALSSGGVGRPAQVFRKA